MLNDFKSIDVSKKVLKNVVWFLVIAVLKREKELFNTVSALVDAEKFDPTFTLPTLNRN